MDTATDTLVRALADAARFERGGDLRAAYDVLVDARTTLPDALALKHRAVLMLARAGATLQARREFQRLGLQAIVNDEDIVSLGARLLKDEAMAATGARRCTLARESAAAYGRAFEIRGGAYPGINRATMLLLAGDRAAAETAARHLLTQNAPAAPANAESAYYTHAIAAEACLLLAHMDRADAALAAAVAVDPQNYAARATTLRQLEIICDVLGVDTQWLNRHRSPPALHFCGHMFADTPAEERGAENLRAAIEKALDDTQAGAGFGALAAGTDIVIAEALLARGADLHVVLPMAEEDFLAQSVAPFGQSWLARYAACKAKAATLRFTTHDPFMDDEAVFAFGSEVAMGLAVQQADVLRTEAIQVAVWDGRMSAGLAGTGADVTRWQHTGRRQITVPFPPSLSRTRTARASGAAGQAVAPTRRVMKAMLFADVRGFSRLKESEIVPFVQNLLQPLAEAVAQEAEAPDAVATWGDGLHLIYSSATAAAAGALALQQRFSAIDLTAAGLPDYLALRIGGHLGPVSALRDPFTEADSFYGTQITIAARIEPVAVPGSIYVSEPFTALLALTAPARFRSEYVGQTVLPKGFGSMRLFSLSRAFGRQGA